MLRWPDRLKCFGDFLIERAPSFLDSYAKVAAKKQKCATPVALAVSEQRRKTLCWHKINRRKLSTVAFCSSPSCSSELLASAVSFTQVTCRCTGLVGFLLLLVKLKNGFGYFSLYLAAPLTFLQLNVPPAQHFLRYCIQKKLLSPSFATARRTVSHEADALSRGLRCRQATSVPILPTEPWTLRRRKEASRQPAPNAPVPGMQMHISHSDVASIDKINMPNKSRHGEEEQDRARNEATALDIRRVRMASPQMRDNRDIERQECLLSKSLFLFCSFSIICCSVGSMRDLFLRKGGKNKKTYSWWRHGWAGHMHYGEPLIHLWLTANPAALVKCEIKKQQKEQQWQQQCQCTRSPQGLSTKAPC